MTSLSKPIDPRIIGVTGGSSLVEIGGAHYALEFFRFLSLCKESGDACSDWSLLTDRLFRRYVRREHVQETAALLKRAREYDQEKRFLKIFEAISYCIESAAVNFEGFKSYPGYQYEPVRFVIANQPWFVIEKKRLLSEYDDLKDAPFWIK